MSGTALRFRTRVLLWLAAIAITLASVIYQRVTGPTYPVSGEINLSGDPAPFYLLRSHETTGDARSYVIAPDRATSGTMTWRRYRSRDTLKSTPLIRREDSLIAVIPRQPAAGKVVYEIELVSDDGQYLAVTPQPVVIRFTGPVPPVVLIAHIVFMFAAMLLSTRTGLEAVSNGSRQARLSLITLVTMIIGGLVLGPVVQKFAFNAYWTGWPVGHDLTDTKTAVAAVFWAVALWQVRRSRAGRWWVITAALVTLAIFLIPHSVCGSELDYTKLEAE